MVDGLPPASSNSPALGNLAGPGSRICGVGRVFRRLLLKRVSFLLATILLAAVVMLYGFD